VTLRNIQWHEASRGLTAAGELRVEYGIQKALTQSTYVRAICRTSSSRNVVNGRTDLLTGSAGGKMLSPFDLSALHMHTHTSANTFFIRCIGCVEHHHCISLASVNSIENFSVQRTTAQTLLVFVSFFFFYSFIILFLTYL